MSKLKQALTLFLDYFKIGLFTFGGGYAMLSLIEKTFVEKRKLITEEEFLDITTIAESTPGVIAINSATYIGYKALGILGSAIATIAVSLPSFLIILLIAIFYETLSSIKIISYILKGLSIAVIFLIFRAGLKLFKIEKKSVLTLIISSLSLISILVIKYFNLPFSSIYLILIGGAITLIAYLITLLKERRNEKWYTWHFSLHSS